MKSTSQNKIDSIPDIFLFEEDFGNKTFEEIIQASYEIHPANYTLNLNTSSTLKLSSQDGFLINKPKELMDESSTPTLANKNIPLSLSNLVNHDRNPSLTQIHKPNKEIIGRNDDKILGTRRSETKSKKEVVFRIVKMQKLNRQVFFIKTFFLNLF